MIAQSTLGFVLLFCLYTTSEEIPQKFIQTANSESEETKQYSIAKNMSSNKVDQWSARQRKILFEVTSENKTRKQVKRFASRHKSWLTKHNYLELQDRKNLKANEATQAMLADLMAIQTESSKQMTTKALTPEQTVTHVAIQEKIPTHATTPELMATKVTTPELIARNVNAPELMATYSTTPELIATHDSTPELMATQDTTPELIATHDSTPELMATQDTTPELTATHGSTPELMATQDTTPELIATHDSTPELMATQDTTPELTATHGSTPELMTTQDTTLELIARPSETFKLTATQAVTLKHVASQMLTSELTAPQDFVSESKEMFSKLKVKTNVTYKLTNKINNMSELTAADNSPPALKHEYNGIPESKDAYNDIFEFFAMQDESSELELVQYKTPEQNNKQEVDTKLQATTDITFGPQATPDKKSELKLKEDIRLQPKATQKETFKRKQPQKLKLLSKQPLAEQKHLRVINKEASGYILTKHIEKTTSGGPLESSRSNILSSNSNKEENTSKYSGCQILVQKKSVILLCRHLNLTYIPEIEIKIDDIIFEYNNIQNVTMETFSNISEPDSLNGLTLNYNNICNISSNALDKFTNLRYLHLSGNPFYYNDLKYLLGAISKLKNLKFLRIDDVHTITIQYDLFSLMSGTRIDFLILKLYKLGSFSLEVFRHFSYLKRLVLGQNNITDIKLYSFSHLERLYLDVNLQTTLPDFCNQSGNHPVPYFPRLFKLSFQNNKILIVRKDSFKCLSSVKELQIGLNYLNVIPNDFLRDMPELYYLDMKNQNGRFSNIEPFAFRSNSLINLRIGFNADALSVFSSLNDTFKFAPNIQFLKIDYISMSHFTDENFRQLFGPLTNLKFLRCFACKITLDPKSILANKPNLNNLDLGSNLVQTLSHETFIHNKNLKKLKMRFNKIGHLQEIALPNDLLDNLEVLDLSKNPFTCDCNLLWLIDWLKTSTKTGKNVTLNYPNDYECSNPADKADMKLSEVNFSYRECHPWSPGIWVAVVVCPCIVVISIISLVVYRNRWNIKHYIYLLRKRQKYQLIHGQNYEYDAFVAYEADDSVWVRRNLLPILEEGEGLKLCIHERDFQAGMFINDNIVRSMDRSKKIILILTNKFACSEWCIFELKVAHSKLIESETDVVVVLLEKIDGRNMNHCLRLLFQTTTYIEWTEDVVGRELFWNKLKDTVKK